MSILKLPLQVYSFFVIVFAFIFFILPLSIIAIPFSVNIRLKIVSPGWQLFSKTILYLGAFTNITKIDERDVEVQKERQPKGLHIANHQSFMDIPLLITSFQIPPIMKKEILYIPIFGLCGYAAGAMIVDRSRKDSRKRVFEQSQNRLLKEFQALQYYPEGTRQKSENTPKPYEEIKKPLMKFAFENNIKLYPTSIYGTKKILNKRNGLVRYFQRIGIKHHKGLHPKDFSSSEDFMRAAWDKVLIGHQELAEKIK